MLKVTYITASVVVLVRWFRESLITVKDRAGCKEWKDLHGCHREEEDHPAYDARHCRGELPFRDVRRFHLAYDVVLDAVLGQPDYINNGIEQRRLERSYRSAPIMVLVRRLWESLITC